LSYEKKTIVQLDTHRTVALAENHDKVVLDGLIDLVLVVGHFVRGSAGMNRSSLSGGEYRTYLVSVMRRSGSSSGNDLVLFKRCWCGDQVRSELLESTCGGAH